MEPAWNLRGISATLAGANTGRAWRRPSSAKAAGDRVSSVDRRQPSTVNRQPSTRRATNSTTTTDWKSTTGTCRELVLDVCSRLRHRPEASVPLSFGL
ncbi:hypothetical protein E4U53_007887 [Claviceps sorghi]|nr:hypothetical protein E4U53_007887 [Claviceps sorghi]